MRPSEKLRQAAAPVWSAILAHPFLKELADGTLPRNVFRFYVQQDWLYLQEFTRTAAVIAGRAPAGQDMKALLTYVEPLVSMEYHFHKKHAAELGLDFERAEWQMNETNYAYTRHMLATAHTGSLSEALAALLPCPCVYAYVGEKLTALLRDGRPAEAMYVEWIEFYGPGRVAERIKLLETLYDTVAVHASNLEQQRAVQNYIISSRYEWLFWDSAYHQRDWPV